MTPKIKRLMLGEYAEGVTIASLANKYQMSQAEVKVLLREQGVVFEQKTSDLTFRQRVAALDRKLSQSRMELYREKQLRDKAEKRVYQLEAEFRRRGIPLP